LTPQELEAELARDEIRGAYLLIGEEPLLRDDSLAAIRRRVLDGSADDFNQDRFEGSKTTPAALADAVHALPVMARRRLVVLTDPEPRRGRGRELADSLPDLVSGLKAMDESGPTSVLVVVAAKADKRSRWVKAFKDPAGVVECVAPRAGRSLTAFVKAEAKRQGLSLEPGAVDLLCERVGPQLLMLRNEIAKSALVAGVGEPISRAHIAEAVNAMAEEPIWDLTDAIGEGRVSDALGVLGRMLAAGAPAPVVLASLAGHFRKLIRVRSGASIAGPPFLKRKLEGQARRYTSRELLACLGGIHRTDLALKGVGLQPADRALEELVLDLTR
jgi:DNA polymerase-3 subunit delta